MWFYNLLATKGEKYYWLPTKIMIKNNYRLLTGNILTDYLTGTDIIDICFYKKRALCIFSSFGSSHMKFMTYPMVLLCCYVYISCYNQYQNHESHTLKNTEFINYIKKKKKPFGGVRHKSWQYTTKRGYWNSLQCVWKFLQRQHITGEKCLD